VARRATSPVLIGRERERTRLEAGLRSAVAGPPVTMLVAGEAGVGKTRLVAEFAASVAGEVTVLAGGCLDERVPYAPVADCLRFLARSGWEPGDAGQRGWSELGALAPDLGWHAPGRRHAHGAAGRLQGAFLQLVEELCRERPVMLLVEDLHWSDASSRNLLMYVMRTARELPLLLVGTYRSDDLTRRHPLRPFLAEAARLPSTDVVELERLDAASTARLLAEILGSRPPPGMADDVYQRGGGNPFLVEELIAADVDRRPGRLSPRLQDILLARTTSLSPPAAEVLRISAVGGPRINDRLLRRVCQLEPGPLDAALRELLDCHILEPDLDDRGYVFRHALTAEAVYEDALPGERVRLHAAYAQAIGEDPELAATGGALAAVERARHWQRARHDIEALPAWVQAASAAESVYAHPEALAAYENVLELWPTIEGAEALAGMDEVELLRRAAEAAHRAGALTRALALAQHALVLLDESEAPLRAAVLAERLGGYSWAAGRESDARSYYQRAVELAPERPPTAERARALAGQARILMCNWLHTPAARFAQEAIETAHQVGAVAVEAHALNTLALALSWMDDEPGALSAMEESARLTEQGDDDENVARLWCNRSELLSSLGRLEEAATVARQGDAVLRHIGLARGLGTYAAGYASFPLVDLGCWDEARTLLDNAIDNAQSGWFRAWPLQQRAWLNWLTGDLDEAERDLDEIQRLAPDLDESQFLAAQAQAVAAVAIETERWDTAVEKVAEAVRQLPVEDGHPVVHGETMTAAWLGLWAAAAWTQERGPVGYAWLAPHLAEVDLLLTAAAARPLDRRTVRDQALLALCEAERGRVAGTANSEDWRRAVDALDALGAVAQRAYARVRLAERLLAEGAARSDAADALNEAVSLFVEAPRSPIRALAVQVAHRARLRLAKEGHSEAEGAPENRFGLTGREADVLRLLAQARTNREIGEVLFISPKTASVHVSSILRKLGVRRRADAVRLVRKAMPDEWPAHDAVIEATPDSVEPTK
jgi:DNA-binding CsgD family transcriptional regulator/tetratricopeptide (TPR) repeat protein